MNGEMQRRDWYLGIALLTLALIFHAVFPRYEYRAVPNRMNYSIRVDRWTGTGERLAHQQSSWLPWFPTLSYAFAAPPTPSAQPITPAPAKEWKRPPCPPEDAMDPLARAERILCEADIYDEGDRRAPSDEH